MTNTITADTNDFGQNLTSGLSKGVRYTLLIVFSVILLMGILNGYRMCAYGMNFSDEPYHILNAMDYKNAPLTVLNALIGHAFGNIFGWNYISFKYFAWTLDLLSIFIAGGFLFYKTRTTVLSLGVTACLVAFESVSRLIFNLYGWDPMVALVLTIILCLTLHYHDRPSKMLLVVISILAALAVMVKVTNIALLPIISVFLIWKHRSLRQAIIFSAIMIVAWAVGIFMIYHSFSQFFYYLHANMNNGHGSLIGVLVQHFYYAFYVLPYIAYFLIMYYIVGRYYSSRVSVNVLGALALIVCNYFTLHTHFIIYGNSYCSLISALGISVVLVAVRYNVMTGLLILAIGVTAHFGSNQSFSKFLFAPAILVSLIYIVTQKNIKSVLLICFILLINMCIFRYERLHEGTFPDYGIQYLTETTRGIDKLDGNYTTTEKAKQINQAYQIANGKRTFVVGDTINKYIYEYMFENINPYNRQAYGNSGYYQKQQYVDSVSSHIARAPHGMQYLYLSNDTTTLMYGMLHEKMPLQRRSDDFILFVKE